MDEFVGDVWIRIYAPTQYINVFMLFYLFCLLPHVLFVYAVSLSEWLEELIKKSLEMIIVLYREKINANRKLIIESFKFINIFRIGTGKCKSKNTLIGIKF